ncbi:hypothetical protein ACWEQ7_36550 [Streptomyces sp. NPDC004069]
MEVTSVGIVMYLVFLIAPGLSSVLKSIAFRIRAAGKAELMRAERAAGSRAAGGRRGGKKGRRG